MIGLHLLGEAIRAATVVAGVVLAGLTLGAMAGLAIVGATHLAGRWKIRRELANVDAEYRHLCETTL